MRLRFSVSLFLAATVGLGPVGADAAEPGRIATSQRAGDVVYRELRLAAALGTLAAPLPGHEPLSRAEIRRLTAGDEDERLPEHASRGVALRIERLFEGTRPWARFDTEGPFVFTAIPDLRVETGLSDVHRDEIAPEPLDHGSRRSEGAGYEHDASVTLETSRFSLNVEGRLRIDRDDADFRALVLTAQTEWRNVRFVIGREPLSWGPGVHGNFLLSTNARPLDQLRIESGRPFRLPGFARRWGDFHLGTFVARLDDPDRSDAPNPWFLGNRLAFIPARWFVFGVTRTAMFAGEGLDFDVTPRTISKLFFALDENRSGSNRRNNSDQKLTFDLSVYLWPIAGRIPGLEGGRVYVEHGGDDGLRGFPPLPSSTATSAGIELVSRGVLFRWEGATNVDDTNLWYTHFLYREGYTHRGRVMGHPMGGDSEAHFVDLEVPVQTFGLLTLGWEWEKHGFRAHPGVPPRQAEEPVPSVTRQTFRAALEKYWGQFPGSLRLEARVRRERGEVRVFGPIERSGLSLSWRTSIR
jgi:hypothetical protein